MEDREKEKKEKGKEYEVNEEVKEGTAASCGERG